MNLALAPQRERLPDWRAGEYVKYASLIREVERRYLIPENVLARLMDYAPDVIEGKNRNALGALGIAQLSREVAVKYGHDLGGAAPYARLTVACAVTIAGRYLRDLYRRFSSWRLAVLAYRWNPELVAKLYRPETGEVCPEIPNLVRVDLERICADVRVPT